MDRKLAIKHELWRRNLIHYKMHVNQKEMLELYKTAPDRSVSVWLLARQSGKSYGIGLLSVLKCQEAPNTVVKILCPTKVQAKGVYEPIFRQIFEDCPEDLKAEYNGQGWSYVFPNGSQIHLAGSDGGHADRLRGQKTDLAFVDEAAFCTDLDNIVNSILLPTATITKGKIILASTPSPDLVHDFNIFIEQAEMTKSLTRKTVYDNPMLTPEDIQQIISRYPGGVNNTKFRREYMCEIIKDEALAVFPEVDDDLLSKIVKEWEQPPYCSRYVSMDIGYRDLTVVLYGYYDFKSDKVIIQDEIVKSGQEILFSNFTKELQQKECDLWTNTLSHELQKPEVRVSDINPFMLQEISSYSKKNDPTHCIDFNMASKNDKLANINKLRIMLSGQKVIINPRCETLIRHIKHCKWKDKSKKDDFDRSQDDGHYDAVDALLYFIRAINYNKNPYPASYGFNPRDLHVQNPQNYDKLDPKKVYQAIFGSRPKRR